MRNILKTGILLLAGTLMAAGVEAGNPDRAGQAGATQLLINPWARTSGWGGVYTSGVRGVESMSFNPAGLSGNRQKTEIGFAHTIWLSGMGIGINAFGIDQKLGEYNALGLALTSFDFGDIKVTREDQPEESQATYNITMLNVALSYAHKFSDNISTGITIRTIAEGVPDASAQGVSLDAGIQYTAGDNERTKFGVALRNVGPPMNFTGNGLTSRGTLEGYENSMTLSRRSDPYELPSVLAIGISYDLFSDTTTANMFTLAGNFTSNAFSKDQFGAEQVRVVREKIAQVIGVELSSVVGSARLFADLGGTTAHLKPLRLAIEAALPVKVEPIVNEVNARTAFEDDGLLTSSSMEQIVEYLGSPPELAQTPVTFPDLFTVGLIEAIVAKALPAASDEPKGRDENRPLQLPPAMEKRVREVVAEVYQIPVADVTSDFQLLSPTDDEPFEFATVLLKVREALGVDVGVELDSLKRWLGEASTGTATPLTMTRLRRLVPNLDTLSDDDPDPLLSVGIIERLCAAAIERRESSEAAEARTPSSEPLGPYLTQWKWDDQDWWASLPSQLGTERYRLFLTGMLRAAFMHQGTLDSQIAEILDIVEKHAETAEKAEALAKKFRAVSKWKWWRNPLWGGLLCLLKPDCTAEDGGGILMRLRSEFNWDHAQVRTAARQWLGSIVAPKSIPVDPAWCTPQVMSLAQRMHDLRTFAEFPKLGDLLEQAGCKVPTILDHCRSPEQRHLRGDWLLTALFAAGPAEKPARASRKSSKASGAGAKPAKAKPPKLSAKQKKQFKEALMQHQGGTPVAAAWSSIWQTDHSRHNESFKEKASDLTPDELKVLGGIYPARMIVLPDVAVARRAHLESPAELHVGLTLFTRCSLFIWHTGPRHRELEEHFVHALAAGDSTSLQWALRVLPYHTAMDHDAYCWSYLALRAIVSRDEAMMATLVDRWPHPEGSDRIPLLDQGLLPILQNDPAGATAALNGMLERERTSAAPEQFGLFSMATHACYRAAQMRNPDLVAGFDVEQTYPWDAEYHAATVDAPDPLTSFDFSATPAILKEVLLTQVIPPWLTKLQNCPRNKQRLVAVVLKDVGPRPDEFFSAMANLFSGIAREDIAYRIKTLPLTLLSFTSADTVNYLVGPLQNAGAELEVVPVS